MECEKNKDRDYVQESYSFYPYFLLRKERQCKEDGT